MKRFRLSGRRVRFLRNVVLRPLARTTAILAAPAVVLLLPLVGLAVLFALPFSPLLLLADAIRAARPE